MPPIDYESTTVVMNWQDFCLKRYGYGRPEKFCPDVCTKLTTTEQRLMGASLLVFLNKTDVEGCMTQDEVRQVS